MAVYEEYTSGNDTTVDIYDAYWATQTFTPSTSHWCLAVNLYLGPGLTRLAVGELVCSLKATDSEGKPTGSDLVSGTLGDYEALAVGDSYYQEVSFGSGYYLTAGTKYAIVCRSPATDGSYYKWRWQQDSSSSSYSGGEKLTSSDSGSTWTADSDADFLFQERDGGRLYDTSQAIIDARSSIKGTQWYAVGFTPSETYTPFGVKIWGRRFSGETPGTLTVSIRATTIVGGATRPTGSDLTSGTYDADTLSDLSDVWFAINFDSLYTLVSGTTYAIVVGAATADRFQWGNTSGAEVSESKAYSTDSGSTWSDVGGDSGQTLKLFGATPTSPSSDAFVTKQLIAIGSNELWYESTAGTMTRLAASVDDIDTTLPLTAIEGFGKVFIANGTNLKVADFINIKITTSDVGANPPDFGTTLTGGTSGATMVVDYITALSSACTIYGKQTSTADFEAETVTGTDDDGNAISFTGTAQESGYFWYDWTVFGQDSSFGTMPETANLVTRYRGRLVLAGNEDRPHQWWMSKVFNPFNFIYSATDPLTAISGGQADAGEVGDAIEVLVPYGDDYMVIGCSSSIYLLDGDPAAGGSLDEKSNTTGIYGPRAWCKDDQYNLYFSGVDGIYVMEGGRSTPTNISKIYLPNLESDLALDKATKRVILSFDPHNNGVLVSATTLTDGTNQNYFYCVDTKGWYPETYPSVCGVYSSFYYDAIDKTYKGLLLGCTDGYIRFFDVSAKDDDSGDSDTAISSYVTWPVLPLSEDPDIYSRLQILTFEVSGGESGGNFSDSDGVTYGLYAGDNAESILETIIDSGTAFSTGTLSAGRSNRIRPRMRTTHLGLKLYNSNASETWAINKIYGDIKPVGKVR